MESLTWQEVVVLDSLFDKFVFIKQATNGFAVAGIADDEGILPSDAEAAAHQDLIKKHQ